MKKALLFTLAFAVLAACAAGGRTSLTPGSSPSFSNAAMPAHLPWQQPRKKHVFYSRLYLASHPDLAARLRNSPPIPGPLLYGGGPVQTAPVTYLVFWGIASPTDTTHDPDGVATYLLDFVSAVPGSTWLNTDSQYYQVVSSVTSYITNPTTQYGGAYYDASLPPSTTYQSTDVDAEALKAATHLPYTANANYIIVTPTGYTTPDFVTKFCGYHTWVSGPSGPVAYTLLPYTPDANFSCGANSVNQVSGTLDGVSIVGGHEIAETQTDPDAATGWIDVGGNEIGDKCAWNDLANTTFPNAGVFPTQPLWSNATLACVQSYTTSATPTPGPTPARLHRT
jgi:hypothetical protein